MEVNFLSCTATIEELTVAGNVAKKTQHRNSMLTLGRNEFRDIVLKLELGKKEWKYDLREITIHKKFVKDGKATIKIPDRKMQLLLSNCPPDKLIMFLKTLHTKLECLKLKGFKSARSKLLSDLPKTFDEISPLTVKELQTVHEIRAKQTENKADLFTPKGKRKRMESDDKENQPPGGVKMARKLISGGEKANPSLTVVNPVTLNKEQDMVLKAVLRGKSIFFTGSAGTGKSFLLRRIIGKSNAYGKRCMLIYIMNICTNQFCMFLCWSNCWYIIDDFQYMSIYGFI